MAEIKKYLDTTALSALVDQIKAEDAKALKSAKDYADSLSSNYDKAGAATTALKDAKEYTDTLANGAVATNTAAIAKLNGDATTEGSVAKDIADAKALIDADVEAVESIANQNKTDIAAINNETTGILAQAKSYTDTESAKIEEALAELDAYIGDIPNDTEDGVANTIVEYINIKTSGIVTDAALEELQATVIQLENDIDAVEADYLKADDKTELQSDIAAAQQTADDAQSSVQSLEEYVGTEFQNLITGDISQLWDTNSQQDERILALEETIDGLSGAMHFEGVKTEIPTDVTGYESGDVIIVGNKEYVFNNGAFVEFGDASVNAKAITALTGRMDTAESDIDTLQSDLDTAEAAIATKAEQTALDEAVEALQGVDSTLSGRIDTLEAKFGEGEGSISDMIADAKQEAIDAAGLAADTKDAEILKQAKAYADEEDAKIETRVDALETASGKHALASDLTTLAGRVTTAEGEIDTLQTEMDAVEALAAAADAAAKANAQAITLKAAQSDLDNAVGRIAQNESDIASLKEASDSHALASDLTAAVERIAKNEADIAANTSAINSFTPITSDEVNALFA